MSHIVTAPLVGVNGADGKVKYLYRGTIVPSDVTNDDVARLVADGLVAPTEDTPKPTGRRAAGGKNDSASAESGRTE
ncbi:hypothetical protein [Rhodococcus sp. BE178]|uniref:hypothetical protein n=1 Tax=Rhodococcus sp. BE178 TaxID=2817737 RepID=UPI003D1A4420